MLARLNKKHVMQDPAWGISVDYFQYPERILQFGTGVLLRGLVDYLVDKANKQGIFRGRVVVVKSTEGDASAFAAQDGLFTTHIKGIAHGQPVDQYLINASISRMLQSNAVWGAVLAAAVQPEMDIIVSNTTEVGIQYVAENVAAGVPISFPGKLLAILYHCYCERPEKGYVIVPTELVADNGKLLQETVLRLAAYNQLPEAFIRWISEANSFCGSLVDRIVPGRPKDLYAYWERAGYEDELWIDAEPFLLWAIEGGEQVAEKLGFHKADERMLITRDITPYREQKLRILNGSHTAAVCVGYLSGFSTVYECMLDPYMNDFFRKVILEEIQPTLWPETAAFAQDVLDRFANPFIEHKLLSITFQQSSKMNTRNVRTMFRYYAEKGSLPEKLCTGFAGMLLFLRPMPAWPDPTAPLPGKGQHGGLPQSGGYTITDDHAGVFAEHWRSVRQNAYGEIVAMVRALCADSRLWEADLNTLPGFPDAVAGHVYGMLQQGMRQYLTQHSSVS